MKKLRAFIILMGVILVSSCAQNMEIDDSRLSGPTSKLTIKAPDLEGFVAIPLMSAKYVSIKVFDEETACKTKKNGKLYGLRDSYGGEFGSARLTPSKFEQTVQIPSNERVFLLAKSTEMVGGNTTTCSSALWVIPEENGEYVFSFKPNKFMSMGKEGRTCNALLQEALELDGEKRMVPAEQFRWLPTRYGGAYTDSVCEV